ncbi:MAG: glgE [Rhodospirillales bacterium]|nr:glgE [Rhodospirillales bacterium]
MVSSESAQAPRIIITAVNDGLGTTMLSAASLGFRQLLITEAVGQPALASAGDIQFIQHLAKNAEAHDLDLWLELAIHQIPLDHPLAIQIPVAFAVRRFIARGPVDPRQPHVERGRALVRFDQAESDDVVRWWRDRLGALLSAGVKGFVAQSPTLTPAHIWGQLICGAHANMNQTFAADMRSLSSAASDSLIGAGFDYCISSPLLAHGGWVTDQHISLSEIAPVIVPVSSSKFPATMGERIQRLRVACALSNGIMIQSGYEILPEPANAEALRKAIGQFDDSSISPAAGRIHLKSVTGAGSPVTAILRRNQANGRQDTVLALINNRGHPQKYDPALIARAGGESGPNGAVTRSGLENPLAPYEVRLVSIEPKPPVIKILALDTAGALQASTAPRVVVGEITPAVDQGKYPVKRVIGDWLIIEADIFTDGHEQIAGEILFKADDEEDWSRLQMKPLENDRWRGEVLLQRLGLHSFAVEAWVDRWGGFVRDFVKKHNAGVDLTLDIREGLALIGDVAKRSVTSTSETLRKLAARIEASAPIEQIHLLTQEELSLAVAEAKIRPFRAVSFAQSIEVERQAAQYSNWYELFPRSQTEDVSKPGRLLDVIDRMPAIKRMGFDVLYFPPIHPIGRKNRKGRNNSLRAEAGDPGSPYAIGSAAGGHDAVDPELGTLEDFRTLVAEAKAHNMEIALDFAIQCSPDHPWLTDHPEWFAWRSDGSIKYAENPPKKYEDIVNVDFYASDSIPDLWLALRDIVLHWAVQGIRIFRVDNPHTKPLPFWHWMIGAVRRVYPDTIFLAEAFTRPKLMYHLAKVGFSQSYTYFTWRNTKAEFIEYMTELNETNVKEFFRPHFFVNTPDINPLFLQHSGRPGFLIRAALATTLSGLWGMYSGFELCEAEALPGREEYKDSEKYEIKPRNWSQPGNIIREITQLNAIRHAEPALQSHLGLTFYKAFNDNILYFGKVAPGQDDKILVAISLDPHQSQEADFEVPLWEWRLKDDAELEAVDLLTNTREVWHGKMQHVRLTPDAPYAIWRIQPTV